MAKRRQEGAAVERLSVKAAHYYARIYASARAGCLAELRRAGCSEEEAEDIFATTLERIMRKFDPAGSDYAPAQMVALLKKACRQKLIDERRHRGVLKLVALQDASPRADATAQSPTEVAEEREAVAMGREAIASLPERDQALFFQRHQLGLAPEEILRRNPGLSLRTYRKVMQRANARTLKAFEEIDNGRRCAQMRGGCLRRYATGEAAAKELATVKAHLRHCRACRLQAAQMRGHLHDIASGLVAVIAVEYAHGGLLAGWLARLLDATGPGVDALVGATRAARERLREVPLRVAVALPGSGGENAAGQLVGLSAAKASAACAAGALAIGCLAAVVPGVGVLELSEHHHHPRHSPSPVASPIAHPGPARTPPFRRAAPASHSASSAATGKEDGGTVASREAASVPHRASESPSRPVISGRQTGAEFGGEADGTGTPLPPASRESSLGEGASPSGTENRPNNPGPVSRGKSQSSAEFGL